MSIYGRILDLEEGKIPIDPFCALMAEQVRGRLTSQAVADMITNISGYPVTPAEQTEINTLLATVVGNTQTKLARAAEINDTFRLSEYRVPGYSTTAELKARLGT